MASPSLTAYLVSPEDELSARVVALGGRPFHAGIVRERVLGAGVLDYASMTSLPAPLRAALEREVPLFSGTELGRQRALDGVTKLLLAFGGGEGGSARASIETVHIPSRGGAAVKGATLCVSTQVGCPVGCPFCASGRYGLERNLDAAEILEQFLRGRALGELSRAVVMGIGEPLLNRRAVVTALRVVNRDLGLGARRITVSTVGYPDRVRAVARDGPPFQLAISLHTPFDAQRDELVPAMAGTPVEEVLRAADDWFEVTGREVTYEYVLLGGCNDSPSHAAELARRLLGRRCTVNLIPFNRVGVGGFEAPSESAIEAFRLVLEGGGVVVTVRRSRGGERDAACGQLRSRRVEEEGWGSPEANGGSAGG